ncbi:MAG TPA: heme-binding protein [Candidatus Limnocylindrales bacterium]
MKQHVSLGSSDAQLAIQVIQSELVKRGKAAVIAVADDHGELLGLLRLDGALLPSIVIATNKAWTAVRERRTTAELGQTSRDPKTAFDFSYYGDPRYIGFGGGVPVFLNGAVIGAISVSGLSQEEDVELAEIGVGAVLEAIGRA